ncbi:MAG: hypothetical protein J6Y84_00710 [Bacteroidaceae bacterium]|nr:hypothetical protein [Bacteroidaceae bacterium]
MKNSPFPILFLKILLLFYNNSLGAMICWGNSIPDSLGSFSKENGVSKKEERRGDFLPQILEPLGELLPKAWETLSQEGIMVLPRRNKLFWRRENLFLAR